MAKRCFLVLALGMLAAGCVNGSQGTGSGGSGGAGGNDVSGAGGTGGSGGSPSVRYRPGAVEIRSPAHGSFVEETTGSLEVTGVVTEDALASPELSLLVNGEPVDVNPSDGTWATNVSLNGSAVLQSILATLILGEHQKEYDRIVVMRGASVAKGERAPSSAFIQVTDAGFDVIEPVALSLLPIDFADAVPNGATVLDDACVVQDPLFNLCLARASAVVAGETQVTGGIAVAMDARPDHIALDMSVGGIRVPIRLSAVGFLDCTATASLATMDIEGAFELSPLASDPALVDVTQSATPLRLSASGVDIDVRSCDFDFLTPLVDLLAPAFTSMVQDGMESYLNASLPGTNDTPIAAAIEQAMSTIKVAQTVGLAMNASVDGIFTQIQETDSDALLLADTGFVPACAPADRAPSLDRSLAPGFVAEAMPMVTPSGGQAHHIGLAISPAGFNQLLRTMTECGLLVADLTEITLQEGQAPAPLNSQILGALIPGLTDAHGLDAPMHVELTPTVAPFVTGAAGPGGELIAMGIPHLRVDFVLTESEDLALSIAVDVLGMGVNLVPEQAGTELAFSVNPPTPAQIAVHMLDNPYHAELESIENLLPLFLPGFLDGVVAEIPAFPIPEFAGLTLRAIEVSQANGAIGIFTTAAP